MVVIFFQNKYEKNKLNKSFDDNTKSLELEGVLRESCDVLNPSILFEPIQIENLDFLNFNYCYIKEFNRYYFISNINLNYNNLWRVDLTIDVLNTYKETILNQYCFIDRNEFNFNPLLEDNMCNFKYEKNIEEFVPEKGEKVNFEFKPNNLVDCYCIMNAFTTTPIEYGDGGGIITTNNQVQPSYINETYMGSSSRINYAYRITYNDMDSIIAKELLLDNNKSSFVNNVLIYPFIPPIQTKLGGTYLVNIYLGDTKLDTQAFLVDVAKLNESCIADFTFNKDNIFYNFGEYLKVEFFIPYAGWVSFTPEQVLNKRILINYSFNVSDGSAYVYVINDTDNLMLYMNNVNVAIKYPINNTNYKQNEDSKFNAIMSGTLGVIGSTLGIVGGIASLNPLLIGGGIMGMGTSVVNTLTKFSQTYLQGQGQVGTGVMGLFAPNEVRVRITSTTPQGYDENFAKLYGKPLKEYHVLSEMRGFTTCDNFHLEGFTTATSEEIDKIDELLRKGIII